MLLAHPDRRAGNAQQFRRVEDERRKVEGKHGERNTNQFGNETPERARLVRGCARAYARVCGGDRIEIRDVIKDANMSSAL